MSKPSRLLTFLDEKNGFSLSILDARELIAELAVLHHLQGEGFHYFRDSVLTALPMISFLKPGEGFGLYIDSEKPYFRLKIEANSLGNMRTLLIPDTFCEFPEKIYGQGRLSKTYDRTPYTSVIPLNGISFQEVVNSILKDSYQVQSEVRLISQADFSVFVMKLPALNVNKVNNEKGLSLPEYWLQHQTNFNQLLTQNPSEELILSEMQKLNYEYLQGRDVQFSCPCSRDRMILNLKGITSHSTEELFEEGKETLTTYCDYCKKSYTISRAELR